MLIEYIWIDEVFLILQRACKFSGKCIFLLLEIYSTFSLLIIYLCVCSELIIILHPNICIYLTSNCRYIF